MENNKVKNVILAVLVVGLVGMTIAYAGLTQQLLITNNQVTVSSKWRVRFADKVNTTPYGTASVETPATITSGSDNTQISGLRATLKKPGDYVTVAFTIQNEGNIAAKGATEEPIVIGKKTCSPVSGTANVSGLCELIQYTVLHADGTTPFSSDDTLAAWDQTSTTKPHIDGILKVELPSSVTSKQMAAYNGVDVNITGLTATFNFIQN